MITSTGNSQVREIVTLVKKAKERREQGVFIVEGLKMFEELPKSHLEKAFVSENFLSQLKQQNRGEEEFFAGCRCEVVSDDVMKYMSDTRTPQGILAVAKQFSYTLSDILSSDILPSETRLSDACSCENRPSDSGKVLKKSAAHLIALERLQDPGNLGTILRAGEGAGITGVIMNRETADIYNPKVIRSTMGSIYRVPFVYTDDLAAALRVVKHAGIRLYAAHLKGTCNYEEEDYRGNVGFLIGNEANGLSHEIASMADCYVKIPMAGKVESLNAAVAASVLMFETARQRRI